MWAEYLYLVDNCKTDSHTLLFIGYDYAVEVYVGREREFVQKWLESINGYWIPSHW
jgi:hypothetical protein